jgi:hypothetical protein
MYTQNCKSSQEEDTELLAAVDAVEASILADAQPFEMDTLASRSAVARQEREKAFRPEAVDEIEAFCAELDAIVFEPSTLPAYEPTVIHPAWTARIAKEKASRARYVEIPARHASPDSAPTAANDDTRFETAPEPAAPVIFPDGEPIEELAPIEPAPASVRKKGPASQARRDSLADACFLREYRALTGIAAARPGVRSLVYRDQDPTTPIPTAPMIPWASTKTPAPWRYVSDQVQAHFGFEALQTLGPVVAFTAQLSRVVDIKARATGNVTPWLHKRLKKALDKALGRSVAFLFVVEEEVDRVEKGGDGMLLLHVHGILQVDPGRRQLDKVRGAIRAAFGTWEEHRKRSQIKIELELDAGWPAYITKVARWAAPRMRAFLDRIGLKGLAPTFAGMVLTMSHEVTRIAKEKHEEARQAVQEARTRPSAVPDSQTPPETAKPTSEPLKRFLEVSVRRPQLCRSLPLSQGISRHIQRYVVNQSVAHRSTGPPSSINIDLS